MYCTLPVKVKTQRRGLRSPSSTWTGGFFISYDDQIMVMVMIYRCLILFNLDRWVLSYYDDPADQIMVMVVITQKAVMMKQLTISHSLTIVRSLRCQIV